MKNETIRNKFIGIWELVYVDTQTIDGKDLERWIGEGRLIYTKQGYISAQIGEPKIKKFKSENRLKATDKELRLLFNSFESYYGKYEIDEENGVIKHHVELSLFPNWIGTTQERSYKFLNDHLELKAVGKEERIQYTLKWKRL